MSWSPPKKIKERANSIIALYPDKRAACIPILHLIQEQEGYIPKEAPFWVGELLSMENNRVEGVISFYTMFKPAKLGKYHLELCTNVSCSLCGSEQILREIEKELGVKSGETTPDGLFTLSEVECLASCGMGPAMQVGDKIYEHLTPEKAVALIKELRNKAASEKSNNKKENT